LSESSRAIVVVGPSLTAVSGPEETAVVVAGTVDDEVGPMECVVVECTVDEVEVLDAALEVGVDEVPGLLPGNVVASSSSSDSDVSAGLVL
jgi:hypothetical protein